MSACRIAWSSPRRTMARTVATVQSRIRAAADEVIGSSTKERLRRKQTVGDELFKYR